MGALKAVVTITGAEPGDASSAVTVSGDATQVLHFDSTGFGVERDTSTVPPRVKVQARVDAEMAGLPARMTAAEADIAALAVYAVPGEKLTVTPVKTAAYTAVEGDLVRVDLSASSGLDVDITLPAASAGNAGRIVRVVELSALGGAGYGNACNVIGTFEGNGLASPYVMNTAAMRATFVSTGTGWILLTYVP